MKYEYQYLEVMCIEHPKYRIDQMREAVEYLRGVPQTGYTGLVATTSVDVPPRFKLLAQPMLQLSDILGKTESQVWAMFDQAVDEQILRSGERWNAI